MGTEGSAGPDPIRASAFREYRASLGLLAAGIAIVVVLALLGLWFGVNADGGSASPTGLALAAGWTAGGMLMLLAGTVAYYHRSFLRARRQDV